MYPIEPHLQNTVLSLFKRPTIVKPLSNSDTFQSQWWRFLVHFTLYIKREREKWDHCPLLHFQQKNTQRSPSVPLSTDPSPLLHNFVLPSCLEFRPFCSACQADLHDSSEILHHYGPTWLTCDSNRTKWDPAGGSVETSVTGEQILGPVQGKG